MATEEVRLKVVADTMKAAKDLGLFNDKLKQTGKTAKQQQGTLGALKTSYLAYGYALKQVAGFIGDSMKASSDLNEEYYKFKKVFGDSVESMKIGTQAVNDLTTSYNMSQREAYQLTAKMQDLLKPMGMLPTQAGKLSSKIVKLAADMGSFNNVPTEQALEAIRSSMIGMHKPMRQFGADLSVNKVKQEAFNEGLYDGKGEISGTAKLQATYNLILKSQADAYGDVIRTQDSYANQLKRTQANIEDFKAGLGQPFIDAAAGAMGAVNKLGISMKDVGETSGNVLVNMLLGPVIGGFRALKNLVTGNEEETSKLDSAYDELNDAQRNLDMHITTGNTNMNERLMLTDRLSSANDAYAQSMVNPINALEHLNRALEGARKKQKSAKSRKRSSNYKKQLQEQQTSQKILLDGQKSSYEKEREALDLHLKNSLKQKGMSDEKVFALKDAHSAQMADVDKREKKAALDREREHQQKRQDFMMNATQQIFSGVSAVMAQYNAMESQQLANKQEEQKELFDAEQEEKELALQTEYEAEKARIEATVKDEDQKAKQLAALEKKKLEDEKKLEEERLAFEEKQEKERRALARKQAKINKAIQLTGAIISTASAVTGALGAKPWTVGNIVLASIVGALGAAQVGLIAATPLPRAASGGIIPGSAAGTQLIAGENNASEAIIPFENDEVMDGLGGLGTTVNVYIENAYGSDDLSAQFKNAVDQALFELDQDGNCLFAERVRT